MASLKEIKTRISSVQSTLKITSAMKMVASAKLHRAQVAIEGMLPYEQKLRQMLQDLQDSGASLADSSLTVQTSQDADCKVAGKVALVAFSSNSSLCGGFNANVIRETRSRLAALRAAGERVELICVGRKIADTFYKSRESLVSDSGNWNNLVATPSFAEASRLAQYLLDGYTSGLFSRIELIYNHFVSVATQRVVCETYLPLGVSNPELEAVTVGHRPTSGETFTAGSTRVGGLDSKSTAAAAAAVASNAGSSKAISSALNSDTDIFSGGSSRLNEMAEPFIVEPSPSELLEALLPRVMRLRIYTVLLDTTAAEHAARTVAMQTATDNGETILADLTLEYNKGRQQKITAEILDIVGGSLR